MAYYAKLLKKTVKQIISQLTNFVKLNCDIQKFYASATNIFPFFLISIRWLINTDLPPKLNFFPEQLSLLWICSGPTSVSIGL